MALLAEEEMMRSFSHSGDSGDILYALPMIRLVGGGDLYLTSAPWTRAQPDFYNIFELLNQQPYLNFVGLHGGQYVSHNLDAFRAVGTKEDNIASRHCRAFSLPDDVINQPWLTVKPWRMARVIINRTKRYRNEFFPWQQVVDKYRNDAAFVGTIDEYWDFTARYGYVRRLKTSRLLEVAEVIAGADLFIGNQSAPCAIAEGLKKRVILEVYLPMPNCCFNRDDQIKVTDGTVELPDLCNHIKNES